MAAAAMAAVAAVGSAAVAMATVAMAAMAAMAGEPPPQVDEFGSIAARLVRAAEWCARPREGASENLDRAAGKASSSRTGLPPHRL